MRIAFTWDPESMDPEIYERGLIVGWFDAGRKAMDNFVVALSNRIGAKCDWSYCGGRPHVDTLPENFNRAQEAIKDEAWMKSFLKPFNESEMNLKDWFVGWVLTQPITGG